MDDGVTFTVTLSWSGRPDPYAPRHLSRFPDAAASPRGAAAAADGPSAGGGEGAEAGASAEAEAEGGHAAQSNPALRLDEAKARSVVER